MKYIFILLCSCFTLSAQAGLILHNEDFISESEQTNFNGFELMSGSLFRNGKVPYVENNIQVRQINGQAGNDIYLGYEPIAGTRSWLPNGGDYGYTEITMANGSDFYALELMFQSPNIASHNLLFSVWDNGAMVLQGSIEVGKKEIGFIGFEGRAFDQVVLRSAYDDASFFDRSQNGLKIDNIQAISTAPVAEPPSLSLILLPLLALILLKLVLPEQRRLVNTNPKAPSV